MFAKLLSRWAAAVAAVSLVAAMAVLAQPASASDIANENERHCSVTVTGKRPSGELITTKPVCSSVRPSEAPAAFTVASVVAVHYSLAGFGGSTFTVNGTGCTGGYLNLPSTWVDVISSTWSNCTVTHFDFFYLTGSSETTYGSGNLTMLDNKTNSARYS